MKNQLSTLIEVNVQRAERVENCSWSKGNDMNLDLNSDKMYIVNQQMVPFSQVATFQEIYFSVTYAGSSQTACRRHHRRRHRRRHCPAHPLLLRAAG